MVQKHPKSALVCPPKEKKFVVSTEVINKPLFVVVKTLERSLSSLVPTGHKLWIEHDTPISGDISSRTLRSIWNERKDRDDALYLYFSEESLQHRFTFNFESKELVLMFAFFAVLLTVLVMRWSSMA